MADNVVANSGDASGATFATDDIASVHYPLTKIELGAMDSSDGPVSSANPMPVIASASDALLTTIDTKASSIVTDASTIAGAVAAGQMQVDIVADGAGLATAANQSTAITALQLIDDIVATDDTSTHSGTTKGAVIMAAATPTDGSVDANDLGAVAMSTDRRLHVDSQIVGQDADISIADGGNSITVDQATASNFNAQAVGNVASAATDSGNPVKVGGVFNTTQPTVTNGQRVDLQATNRGALIVATGVTNLGTTVGSIAAGTNLIGDVGISGARTTGGTTIFRSISVINSTLQVVKAAEGQLYWIHAMNLASSVRFLKIYNATSGTIGTGTPVLTFPIATQGDTNGAGFMLSVPNGVAFSTGICLGASTGIADGDTGAPGANEVIVNIGYA